MRHSPISVVVNQKEYTVVFEVTRHRPPLEILGPRSHRPPRQIKRLVKVSGTDKREWIPITIPARTVPMKISHTTRCLIQTPDNPTVYEGTSMCSVKDDYTHTFG
jgi:hypothetical protein